MKRLLITLLLAAALLALLVASPLAGAGGLQPTVLTDLTWGEYGSFAESMAVDSHGDLYVTLTRWGYADETTALSNYGDIWKVTPAGQTSLLASIDCSPYGMLTGIAIDGADRVYAAVWDASFAPESIGSSICRVKTGGAVTTVAQLPTGSWPNGIAFHNGRLYISDSGMGAIWRVRVDGLATPATPWFQDSLLMPSRTALGINGIAFKGDALYGIVSATGRVVRLAVKNDGTPGEFSVLTRKPELKSGDGVAFDVRGRLWVATNGNVLSPAGGVYRVSTGGTVTAIAEDVGWLNYPTMPVFGRTAATATTLFVANGAYNGWLDGSSPNVIALLAGVVGLPLL